MEINKDVDVSYEQRGLDTSIRFKKTFLRSNRISNVNDQSIDQMISFEQRFEIVQCEWPTRRV